MSLSTGSPVGNPGYSFASRWSLSQYLKTRKGYYTVVVWVGKTGGDTPENRLAFEEWLRTATICNPVGLVYGK
jgi:hypothetical protein